MTSPGRLLMVGFLAATGVSACEGSKTTPKMTPIACTQFASAQALCDKDRCSPTWTGAQTDHGYCESCGVGKCSAGDCGDYHVVACQSVDSGVSYYYRRDNGALVAVRVWAPPMPSASCDVVSTEVFTAPATCDTTTFSVLPGWCSPDAGAPGERAFPCCGGPLTYCGASVPCPATWAQAQAQAPALCAAPQSRPANPELGSCGAGHVFHYQPSSFTSPLTLYYDASGALIAMVDEGTGRCMYGPADGLTVSACDAPLMSACTDGGGTP